MSYIIIKLEHFIVILFNSIYYIIFSKDLTARKQEGYFVTGGGSERSCEVSKCIKDFWGFFSNFFSNFFCAM